MIQETSQPVENQALERVRRLAWLMDNSIPIPGTRIRIGLDPLIGLIPGLGDFAGAIFSGYIVLVGTRLGASRGTILRMIWNVLVETVIGMVPILGDIFDAGWKANARNMALLERTLANEALAHRRDSRFVLALGLGLTGLLAAVFGSAFLLIRWLF
jgi:Domain of unknown function (DUF4112)